MLSAILGTKLSQAKSDHICIDSLSIGTVFCRASVSANAMKDVTNYQSMLSTQIVLKINHYARKFDLPPSSTTHRCMKLDQPFSKLDKSLPHFQDITKRWTWVFWTSCSKKVNLYLTLVKKRVNCFSFSFLKSIITELFNLRLFLFLCVCAFAYKCVFVLHKRECVLAYICVCLYCIRQVIFTRAGVKDSSELLWGVLN